MKCTKCNATIKKGYKYCNKCATFVTNKHISSKQKISKYYGNQFHKLQTYKKAEFNFAAYLLFPFHLIYRKCIARFFYLAFPIIFIWSICTIIISIVPFGYNLYVFFYAPSVFCPLIFITLGIFNGITFNKYYYHKLCGNAHVPTNKRGVLLFVLIIVLFIFIVVILFIISRILFINNLYYFSNYYFEPILPKIYTLHYYK